MQRSSRCHCYATAAYCCACPIQAPPAVPAQHAAHPCTGLKALRTGVLAVQLEAFRPQEAHDVQLAVRGSEVHAVKALGVLRRRVGPHLHQLLDLQPTTCPAGSMRSRAPGHAGCHSPAVNPAACSDCICLVTTPCKHLRPLDVCRDTAQHPRSSTSCCLQCAWPPLGSVIGQARMFARRPRPPRNGRPTADMLCGCGYACCPCYRLQSEAHYATKVGAQSFNSHQGGDLVRSR